MQSTSPLWYKQRFSTHFELHFWLFVDCHALCNCMLSFSSELCGDRKAMSFDAEKELSWVMLYGKSSHLHLWLAFNLTEFHQIVNLIIVYTL